MKSNEQTLAELKRELLRIGSTNQADYDSFKKEGQVYSTTIIRRLGASWREIIDQIGLKPARVLLPNEDMLNALKDEFKRLGSYTKPVYIEKRNKKTFPHPRVLTKHLNMSWKEITKACGRKDITEFATDNVSDEELINEYKAISKVFGRPATVEEIRCATNYSFELYRQHFGTIGELRKACGFKWPTKRGTPVITKEDCERELKAIYNKHGRLSYSQLTEKSTISMSTMFRRFHTTKINEIWDEVLNERN